MSVVRNVTDIVEIARKRLTLDMDMGFIVVDVTGKIIELNEQAAFYYGSNVETLLLGTEEKKLPGFPKDYCFCKRTLDRGIPYRNYTVGWKVQDKNRKFVVDTMILRADDGEIIGACAILKDITNMKSLELQIQHNDRLAMIGQIAAGAAHEIRNPITSIRGFLQFLRRSLVEREMTKEVGYTDVMLSELDRITELISEFLQLSKPREMALSECTAKELIDAIAPILDSEALLHENIVDYDIEDTPNIKVDRELIKQVFLNIAQNAMEAMATTKGKLSISAKYQRIEKQVVFSFKDTGPGIPAYMIDKIFDPFFTTKDSGTGLGLSVCQRIVSDLGGQIKVSSKGFGTTFTINLPVN